MGALLLLLCFAAACSGSSSSDPPHTISANNYSRACTSVADCFPVYEGTLGCCGPGCPNTAIRADLATQYMTASDNAAKCTIQPPCASPGACAGRVECVAGVCQLEMPADDAGTGE